MEKIDTKLHVEVVTVLTEKISVLQTDLDFIRQRNNELVEENINLQERLESAIQDHENKSFSRERNLENQLYSIKTEFADVKNVVDNDRIFAEYEASHGKLFNIDLIDFLPCAVIGFIIGGLWH